MLAPAGFVNVSVSESLPLPLHPSSSALGDRQVHGLFGGIEPEVQRHAAPLYLLSTDSIWN